MKMSLDDITVLSDSSSTQREIVAESIDSTCQATAAAASATSATTIQMINDRNHVFRIPKGFVKKVKIQNTCATDDSKRMQQRQQQQQQQQNDSKHFDRIRSYKLCPKVFGVPKPISASAENLTVQLNSAYCHDGDDSSNWGSLQELRAQPLQAKALNTFVEGTCSEPDITISTRTLPNASPFKRWGQSSFRSTTSQQRHHRPSSLAASESDVYTKTFPSYPVISSEELNVNQNNNNNNHNHHQDTIDGCDAWGTSFEKLLDDPTGLHTFAEFLKKEFSAENIYFWSACERYRQLIDHSDRQREATAIYERHLGGGASEPVNVDSQARNIAEENLQQADADLFAHAQKQIFNLMKFDSYQRFIRSALYKSCLEAEANGQPLPYRGDQLDANLRTWIDDRTDRVAAATAAGAATMLQTTKLKKSLSNAEDRRRKSLLPWHRKVRCKSKDRNDQSTNDQQSSGGGGLKAPPSIHSGGDIHSSRSSLSSFDAALSCRSTTTTSAENADDTTAATATAAAKGSLCRVFLTDGATTIVQTRPDETVRILVERLLEKRAITYKAYEVFISGCSKSIDLDAPNCMLAGKEVFVEQRIVFKLDLPNKKVISVKSKPTKALAEVLRPILHKYNYSLDLVQIYRRDCNEALNMTLSVTTADGQRLQVICNADELPGEIQPICIGQMGKIQKFPTNPTQTFSIGQSTQFINYLNQTKMAVPMPSMSRSIQQPPQLHQHQPHQHQQKSMQQVKLDEITNKVFNQLLQGKVDLNPSHIVGHTIGQPADNNVQHRNTITDHESIQSGDWSSEASSCSTAAGLLGRLRRRNSNQPINRLNNSNKKFRPPSKNGSTGDGSTEDGGGGGGNGVDGIIKKPLIAKLKAGVKLQVTTTNRTDANNHDSFLEGLKRAQCSRLEDQRGTEINFELPDFLKDKENRSIHNNNRLNGGGGPPVGGAAPLSRTIEPIPLARSNFELNQSVTSMNGLLNRPQPAPRLSIVKNNNNNNNNNNNTFNNESRPEMKRLPSSLSSSSSTSMIEQQSTNDLQQIVDETNSNSINLMQYGGGDGGDDVTAAAIASAPPPPLPPKPKVVPIKPLNWGQQSTTTTTTTTTLTPTTMTSSTKPYRSIIPTITTTTTASPKSDEIVLDQMETDKCAYLDQPTSSFV